MPKSLFNNGNLLVDFLLLYTYLFHRIIVVGIKLDQYLCTVLEDQEGINASFVSVSFSIMADLVYCPTILWEVIC